MRKIMFHFHLFKNAGTSIDNAFQKIYEPSTGIWDTREFPAEPAKNLNGIKNWILERKETQFFSSHTANFPLPELPDIEIFPIIFVRHPIDRIKSAYSFEKKQGADNLGSTLARNTTFQGYVETRLKIPGDRQCKNFHLDRFSRFSNDQSKSELERAKLAFESLPFVGVVEGFQQSLERMCDKLKQFGFGSLYVDVMQSNVSQNKMLTIEDKMDSIRDEFGGVFMDYILEANRDDMAFYDYIVKNSTC